jgi:hydroxymethylpyrimidine kinase/phosphomethylpyrimidine kinase
VSTAGPAVALTIGGSDSGGSYGVQADLRTFAALGVHGAVAFTVLTAQNTATLRAAHPVPVDFVVAQLDAVLDDFKVGATKTGMLGRVEVIEAVAALAEAGRLPNLVVDPVLVGNRGQALFPDAVVEAYRERLLPLAAATTPNEPEAALLTGETTAAAAAEALGRSVQRTVVVVTGGRSAAGDAVDTVWAGGQGYELRGQRLATPNVAGTGDAFSAVVTARLAQGWAVLDAVTDAKAFVAEALRGGSAWALGAGPGPLDHLGWSARS